VYKTIFASMTGQSSQRAVLETALLVSRMFDATVDCVHVRLDSETMMRLSASRPFSTEIFVEEQVKFLEREALQRAEAAHTMFESFRNSHLEDAGGTGEFPLRWQSVTGIDTDETILRSRAYDLVIIGRDVETYSLGKSRIGAILMGCGRPVLIAPERAPKTINGTIVVAWKNCAEAARALAVALPFLLKAKQVVIAFAREGKHTSDTEAVVQQLLQNIRREGCLTDIWELSEDGRSASDRLRALCLDLNADLMIMGAYGHSRLREFVFGGVTSDVIESCATPVLMFH